MEITGIILKKLPLQSGESANGPWQRQEFIVQTEDQYPKTVCFSLWGKNVDDLSRYAEQDRVKVFFDVSSREYNERWYTDLRAWRIQADDGVMPQPQVQQQPQQAQAPKSTPSSSSSIAADNDDLPF